jgi:hypothetical protein
VLVRNDNKNLRVDKKSRVDRDSRNTWFPPLIVVHGIPVICMLIFRVVMSVDDFCIKTMFGSSLPPVVCRRGFMSNFSGLSIFDCPSVFSKGPSWL